MSKRIVLRTRTGSVIVEQPVILMVLFFFLAVPFINLASIGLRSYFVVTSAREAAHRACKSLTYDTVANLSSSGVLANNVPAVSVANTTVGRYLTAFNGVKASTVKVGIVYVNNLSGQKSGPYYRPLSDAELDLTNNTYYLDVQVVGKVDPLITYSGGMLGKIPGLTEAFGISTHGQDVFENPKGLTL